MIGANGSPGPVRTFARMEPDDGQTLENALSGPILPADDQDGFARDLARHVAAGSDDDSARPTHCQVRPKRCGARPGEDRNRYTSGPDGACSRRGLRRTCSRSVHGDEYIAPAATGKNIACLNLHVMSRTTDGNFARHIDVSCYESPRRRVMLRSMRARLNDSARFCPSCGKRLGKQYR